MSVVDQQSVTAEASGNVSVTLNDAPAEGSLLIASLFSRGDIGNEPTPTIPSGWTFAFIRNTLPVNSSYRRGFAVAYKIAEASEPAALGDFNYNAQNFNTTLVAVHEYLGNDGEVFELLEVASNDNGTTDNATTIATGTTASVDARPLLLVGLMGARVGGDGSRIQGTSSWDNEDLAGITNHPVSAGSNTRILSTAFAEQSTSGTKASTATTTGLGSPPTSTGLSAGILVVATSEVVVNDPENLAVTLNGSTAQLSWDASSLFA